MGIAVLATLLVDRFSPAMAIRTTFITIGKARFCSVRCWRLHSCWAAAAGIEHADQRLVTCSKDSMRRSTSTTWRPGRFYTNRRFREFLSAGGIGSAGEIEPI
jgi:hypothetical protein